MAHDTLKALSISWRETAEIFERDSRTASRQREVSLLAQASTYRNAAHELDALLDAESFLGRPAPPLPRDEVIVSRPRLTRERTEDCDV